MQNKFVILALICNLLWSTSYAFQKQATLEIPSHILLFYRFFLAFLCMLPYVIHKKIPISNLKNYPFRMLILGLLIYTISPWMQIFGISQSKASDAGILASTEPLFAILIAFVFLKERLSKKQVFGASLMFLGVFFMTPGSLSFEDALPGILILVSVWIEASQGVILKPMLKNNSPLSIAFSAYFLASCFSAIGLFQNSNIWIFAWKWQTVFSVFALGVFCTAIAYTLWYRVLQEIDVSVAILFVYTQPLFSTLIAWFFLNETPGKREALSLFFILLGLFFVIPKARLSNNR